MFSCETIEISNLEDLEDQVNILKEIVSLLSTAGLSKAELEIHMSQYVLLEESILKGIKLLEKSVKHRHDKSKLEAQIETFNKLGCDYQDTWNELYWSCYEMIKEGNIGKSMSTLEQINRLQNLALVMNKKKNLVIKKSCALEEVDELSNRFKPDLELEPVGNRKCCVCFII